jgi:hypothetical protein
VKRPDVRMCKPTRELLTRAGWGETTRLMMQVHTLTANSLTLRTAKKKKRRGGARSSPGYTKGAKAKRWQLKSEKKTLEQVQVAWFFGFFQEEQLIAVWKEDEVLVAMMGFFAGG